MAGLYILRALIHGERGNMALATKKPGLPEQDKVIRSQAVEAFRAALSDYSEALQKPLSVDLHYVLLVNRGGMYLQAADDDKSWNDLQAAIKLHSDPYQAYLTLAQWHQQKEQIEQAATAFGQAIERVADPGILAQLHRSRGRLFSGNRGLNDAQRELAIRDLERAVALEPVDPEKKASDHVELARLHFGAGRYEQALAACGEALHLMPEQQAALLLKISSLMVLKRYDEVLVDCDTFLKTNPEQPPEEVLEIRGLARIQRRNWSGAIADLTAALGRPGLEPATQARLLNERGSVYQMADSPRLSLEDFEASLKLMPNHGEALAGRGLARIRLGEYKPAVVDAETAVKLTKSQPTDENSLERRRQVYLNAARIYAQAVEFAANGVSREGERAVIRYRGYRARALELLREALRDLPPTDRKKILSDPALRPLGRLSETLQAMK